MSKTRIQSLALHGFDISLLYSVGCTYLGLNTQKRGEQPGNSHCGQVLGREVSVEPLELVQGQEDAEQVDHDPQSVQDVVSIRTLKKCDRDITIHIIPVLLAPGPGDTRAGECERLRQPLGRR